MERTEVGCEREALGRPDATFAVHGDLGALAKTIRQNQIRASK